MILKYSCVSGRTLALDLAERFGAGVDIEALQFVDALPMERRLVFKASPAAPWKSAMPERKTFAFHDLQVPCGNGTRGTKASGVSLETRGIGGCVVLVWLREGTYRERQSSLVGISER